MRTKVDELKMLQQEGLNDEHFSKTVKVNLKYIIADTPCRASMKHIKTSGYDSCERCTVIRRPLKCTIVFPEDSFAKRNNNTFRQRVHHHHHKTGERSIYMHIFRCQMPEENVRSRDRDPLRQPLRQEFVSHILSDDSVDTELSFEDERGVRYLAPSPLARPSWRVVGVGAGPP